MTATILVKFTQEGLHAWPEAPPHRAYLAKQHRHLFFVEVQTTVTNDDREIEFHDLRQIAIDTFVESGLWDDDAPLYNFGRKSCEQLARELATSLANNYRRTFTVGVFEDNECGAIVTTEFGDGD